jgi:hemerythrin-like domain-containing protein
MGSVLSEKDVLRETVAQQVLLEHEILRLVTAALRLCVDWDPAAVSAVKKRSTVSFTAQSFRRHLERLFDLEEAGGYLQLVRERQPALIDEASRLRRQHDQFRQQLATIVARLEECSRDDAESLEQACEQVRDLLSRLDEHHLREIDLLQEAAERDIGGEG